MRGLQGQVHVMQLRQFSNPTYPKKKNLDNKKYKASIDFTPSLASASSFLTSLRLKAASALTSSLSSTERDQILFEMGALDVIEAEKIKRTSVGEAVAMAVAKEANKQSALMEEEKQKIYKFAETAALERVKNDLLIRERKMNMEKMHSELKEARTKIENMEKEQKERKSEEMKQKVYMEELQQYEKESNGLNNKIDDSAHPILGPIISDLGYKRIHLISSRALSALPIWEKQRVYRHERAKIMAADKLKTSELGLPGIISLYEADDGDLSILDGQHRVGMMAILQNDDNAQDLKFDLENILVEVFPQTSNSSRTLAQDIFTEINKAEPVKLLDMPGIAKDADRRLINKVSHKLNHLYPDMFKPSQRWCVTILLFFVFFV
mmetsp:Transcript_21362/g.29940  ORF Transcript_21362/g.29940 Transcript_21362/m.29940 type:complete len:380 (+) Transcript_21362:53-1192(+)